MDKRTLKLLEFEKIKELLKTHTSSSLGAEQVANLQPSNDYEQVVTLQEETDEAATIYRLKGQVPLGGIFDIRPHLKRAEIGGVLNAEELMQIASTIRISRRIKRFIDELLEEEINLKHLQGITNEITVLADLQKQINKAVDEDGAVLDDASQELRLIRRQILTNQTRIKERLDRTLRSSSADKMLSEKIITIRNDRYVVPVKQEYRSHYGGAIHDQSASGQTLFIEPQAVMQLNNELQHLRVKEEVEIERILRELTITVSAHLQDLFMIVKSLAQLDFIFAKAYFGSSIRGSKPLINNEGIVNLHQARHPLIDDESVVANDIAIGEDYSMIVITGPNTGGKTVALKTLGLCSLMAQSGLQIPCQDGSQVAVFENVFADIGDEQSIEQSLSTFSSHMVNIIRILNKITPNSLVLFDEIGAGTDPQEGTALAISILDKIHQTGARIVATTHYPELKAYGYNRQGVVNASVEFDVESLSPTYKLLIGIPGRSNAFEIAQRLGLDDTIISTAKTYVDAEDNAVEKMIVSLQKSKQLAEEEESEAAQLLADAENLHENLKEKLRELEASKEDVILEAKEKAKEIVQRATVEADEVIAELRSLRTDSLSKVKDHELIAAKKQLSDLTPTMQKEGKQVSPAQELQVGDEVNVLSLNQRGDLIEKVDDKSWQVQIGRMRVTVKTSDLQFVRHEKVVETKPIARLKGRAHRVKTELDLRGERYEDAILRVEKYIDDALLAGHQQVTIIHGKGTGVLRQGVQKYLKTHPSVKSYRFGDNSEGGLGATVAILK